MKRTIRKLKKVGRELWIFGKFLYDGPEWSQYGIEISFDSDTVVNPKNWILQIHPFQDEVRCQQIIRLLGKEEFIFPNNVRGHINIGKFFVSIYRICRRVNKLKVYL